MELPAPRAKGSLFQVREYVNRHPGQLERAISEGFPDLRGAIFEWTAPLEAQDYREPQDAAFLKAIGCQRLSPKLKAFWPKGGPVWDATAKLTLASGEPGALLVEGKSYPGELRSRMAAENAKSVARIRSAIAYTQASLGLEADPDRWTRSYYQSANRYAHLQFLRDESVNAWLVHVLFLNDATFIGATQTAWETALPAVERELGIDEIEIPHAGHVFLPALYRV